MTQTITVSAAVFNELAEELMRAGREETIIMEKDRSVSLNMHGLVLIRKAPNVVELRPGQIVPIPVNLPEGPDAPQPNDKSELLKGLE